jgi:hypothetical protein
MLFFVARFTDGHQVAQFLMKNSLIGKVMGRRRWGIATQLANPIGFSVNLGPQSEPCRGAQIGVVLVFEP